MQAYATRSLLQLLAAWQQAVDGTPHPQPPAYQGADLTLTTLVERTDEVVAGACFVARVRPGSDGHPHISKAIAAGASLIIGERALAELGLEIPAGVTYLQVSDSAIANAWLAAAWYDFPAQQMVMIGITGTDGKTTTSNLLFGILQAAGLTTGVLSTTRAVIGSHAEPLALHVSTPEAPVLQRYLKRMVEAGVTHCILESTSHGLAQHRVGAIQFDVAVITNITHEHLDYHGSWDNYFAAKAQLFENVAAREATPQIWPACATQKAAQKSALVLNVDDNSFETFAALKVPSLTYGIQQPGHFSAESIVTKATNTHFLLHHRQGMQKQRMPIDCELAGFFNIYNMLAAATAAHALNISVNAIQAGLRQIEGVTGRMERIDQGQSFTIMVDFAHTPFGLEQALKTCRRILAADNEEASGRLIALFGSAGKRDVAKRTLMAASAARLADFTILTAEDPRTESLSDILSMMAAGAVNAGGSEGKTFCRIHDRGQAIRYAMEIAQPNDLILIAGKAHEQSICFGTVEYPWDEIEAAKTAVTTYLAGQPMPDLGLPTFDPDFRLDE